VYECNYCYYNSSTVTLKLDPHWMKGIRGQIFTFIVAFFLVMYENTPEPCRKQNSVTSFIIERVRGFPLTFICP